MEREIEKYLGNISVQRISFFKGQSLLAGTVNKVLISSSCNIKYVSVLYAAYVLTMCF